MRLAKPKVEMPILLDKKPPSLVSFSDQEHAYLL